MSAELAPIVLFVYNRPSHTLRTLEALSKNELASESILFVFADGPRDEASVRELDNIKETRDIIKREKWCKEIHIVESSVNRGLADSIVFGVTLIVNQYGKIIVLEDDIVTSKGFLLYMNDALKKYEEDESVMHIAAYVPGSFPDLPETFFFRQTSCWGWGTWLRAWNCYNADPMGILGDIKKSFQVSEFDLDGAYPFSRDLEYNANGKMKTWAVKWYGSVFNKGGLSLHPRTSLVRNIGADGSGTNSGENNIFDVKNLADNIAVEKISPTVENLTGRRKIVDFYYKAGICSTPFSPLTGSRNIKLCSAIPAKDLITSYQSQFGIDVSEVFTSLPSLKIFKCLDSGYRFFYPFHLAGDGLFYKELQKNDWYYMPWKWEHQIARRYLHKFMNVLEVGCGRGEFLKEILNDVSSVTGLELNSHAIKDKVRGNLDIRQVTIQDHCVKYPEHYDVVCSFQVLEHIADVKSFLEAKILALKEGGTLIISVPNNSGFLKDSDNALNCPPHHMGLWDETSLLYLQKIFNIRHITTHFEPLQQYHLKYFSDVVSKKSIFRFGFTRRLLKSTFIRNLFFTKQYQAYTIQIVFEKREL